MQTVYQTLGTLILVASIVDLVWTTLWVEGQAGPLTSRLMTGTWTALRRVGERRPGALVLAGPSILILTLIAWIVLPWAGWTLIFGSAERTLLDSFAGRPISWTDRVYFVGYTIFTLGNGDLVPRDGVWQIATTLATANGMLLLTLSVTYILSVLDAVSQKRAFANNATGLGESGETFVRTSWDGEEFRGLDVLLTTLGSELGTLTANHHPYPILHYFYSERAGRSPVVAIAVLDEALTLLRFGVREEDRPSEAVVESARSSVESYLETLNANFVTSADRAPPAPDLGALDDAGVPTVPDEEFESAVADLEDRRRALLGLIESDVRQWPSRTGDDDRDPR